MHICMRRCTGSRRGTGVQTSRRENLHREEWYCGDGVLSWTVVVPQKGNGCPDEHQCCVWIFPGFCFHRGGGPGGGGPGLSLSLTHQHLLLPSCCCCAVVFRVLSFHVCLPSPPPAPHFCGSSGLTFSLLLSMCVACCLSLLDCPLLCVPLVSMCARYVSCVVCGPLCWWCICAPSTKYVSDSATHPWRNQSPPLWYRSLF